MRAVTNTPCMDYWLPVHTYPGKIVRVSACVLVVLASGLDRSLTVGISVYDSSIAPGASEDQVFELQCNLK